jgi:hypothetical protein
MPQACTLGFLHTQKWALLDGSSRLRFRNHQIKRGWVCGDSEPKYFFFHGMVWLFLGGLSCWSLSSHNIKLNCAASSVISATCFWVCVIARNYDLADSPIPNTPAVLAQKFARLVSGRKKTFDEFFRSLNAGPTRLAGLTSFCSVGFEDFGDFGCVAHFCVFGLSLDLFPSMVRMYHLDTNMQEVFSTFFWSLDYYLIRDFLINLDLKGHGIESICALMPVNQKRSVAHFQPRHDSMTLYRLLGDSKQCIPH